jgi:hypothetical protein
MKTIPQDVSESTKKRNPHLYAGPPSMVNTTGGHGVTDFNPTGYWPDGNPKPLPIKEPKRLRQSTKPLLNKLEEEAWQMLRSKACSGQVLISQAITFRLANGLRYTPDFFCFSWPSVGEFNRPTAWEIKGPWATDDAIAKVKMFATAYPEIRVILVWRDEQKQWCQQRVLA